MRRHRRIGPALFLASTLAASLLHTTPTSAQDARPSAPLVPAAGVLFGAYVDPDNAWSGNTAAMSEVTQFEDQLGRKLDINQHYYSWTNVFPSGLEQWDLSKGRIPLISWQGPDLDRILSGQDDGLIRSRAQGVKSLGSPVFLRWCWEMNGNWSACDGVHNGDATNGPSRYVAAYRHIHKIFDDEGATNVVWVWAPNAGDVPKEPWNHWTSYYPGDAFVDWVGIDGYNFGTSQSWSEWQSFSSIIDKVYGDYVGSKPIMIAETGSTELGGDKGAWFSAARTAMKSTFPDVAAFVYFHVDKETDWRANSSTAAFSSFKQMGQDPYFSGQDGGVVVGGSGDTNPLSGVGAMPAVLEEWSRVSFALSRDATISVHIKNSDGIVVRHRIEAASYGPGPWGVRWYGKDDHFDRVKPGDYKVVVIAVDTKGKVFKARTHVAVT